MIRSILIRGCWRSTLWLVSWLALTITTYGEDKTPPDAVRDLGHRRELFLDDWLIESQSGVALLLHHPRSEEVVYQFDQPEDGGSLAAYIAILPDTDKLRMYYRGLDGVCYAESVDGRWWTRPRLNKAGKNRLELPRTEAFAPFRDGNPLRKEAGARYLAVGPMDRKVGENQSDLEWSAFRSPDGVQWERTHTIGRRDTPLKPGEVRGMFDSQNVAFWDAHRGEYRAYWRITNPGRAISTATSDDFQNWKHVAALVYAEGTPSEHLYTNAIQPYSRAPHLFIGFPQRFIPENSMTYAIDEQRNKIPRSDVVFMSSRDGLHWRRWTEAFIRPGPVAERWNNVDHTNNMPAWGIVTTKAAEPGLPDELSLYVTEFPEGRAGRLRRHTLRMDGFVSMHAGGPPGEFVTRPILCSGKALELNYATSAAGGIRVELLDPAGKPYPGYSWKEFPELHGDAVDQTISWTAGSDLKTLAGKPVRLRFLMKDADVYSLRFRE